VTTTLNKRLEALEKQLSPTDEVTVLIVKFGESEGWPDGEPTRITYGGSEFVRGADETWEAFKERALAVRHPRSYAVAM
jgi:hypothetical protein